jgi:NADPH2:quinone reductase
MKAAFIESTGPVEVIQVGDLPTPPLGPGQVLVRVKAAAFNPIDLYIRSGMVAMPMSFPYIVGTDVAGVVEELGPGATRFAVGDRVWGSNQGLLGRQGSAAEFAAIDQDWLYPTPANQTDVEAAGQALVGITAYLGLFTKAKLHAGESVYVPGGSGGVGSMVVQMAKAAGARVATSAGSPERVELCRSLGADVALNYKTDDLSTALREFAPDGLDVWYETQRDPNLELTVSLLRKRGRIVVIAGRAAKPVVPLGAFYPRDATLFGFAMFNATPDEQRTAADAMIAWTLASQLRPLIGRTFPLVDTAQAQKILEENSVGGAGTLAGKVVIAIS